MLAPGAEIPRARRNTMRPDELERRLRERLDALGPAPRAELLPLVTLHDFERADAIASHPAKGLDGSCDDQHSQDRNLGARPFPS
jgi:hypothetical protein